MKIYNEVVYHVIDDNLVKVLEDFFEFKGEVFELREDLVELV